MIARNVRVYAHMMIGCVVYTVDRVVSRNTHSCFVCCTSERVNICGNAPLNTTRSSGSGRPPGHQLEDRISSAWARVSDTGKSVDVVL